MLVPQTVVPSTTAVAVADALPNSSQASFIAPNAMIAGDVTVGSGSSAWYGTVLRGKCHRERNVSDIIYCVSDWYTISQLRNPTAGDFGEPTQVGASSHVHERTVVSSSTIGDNVIVGQLFVWLSLPFLCTERSFPPQVFVSLSHKSSCPCRTNLKF